MARVVGHDQTIKSHRTHGHFKKNCGHRLTRWFDSGQKQKKDSVLSVIESIPFYKHITEQSFKKNCNRIKERGTEVNTRTAELCSKQGNTDISELPVIDATTQCEKCKEPNAEGKSFCKYGVIVQELSAENRTNMLKQNSASRDSLERFAVAIRDKTSDKPPSSRSPRSFHRKASFPEGTKLNISKIVRKVWKKGPRRS